MLVRERDIHTLSERECESEFMWKRDRERKLDNVKEMEREYERGGERMCQRQKQGKTGNMGKREMGKRHNTKKRDRQRQRDTRR